MQLDDPFQLADPSPWYGPEHRQFQSAARRFVDREILPFVDEWDEAGEFPRELYRKAADAGLLGLGWPEEFGGTPTDPFFALILNQEIARAGAGGVAASLFSHGIALPPVLTFGSDELKQRVIPPVLAGEKIAALAVTEPEAGSDVAAIRTRARREGDEYVVNGSKTFITSGMRADFYTVAVRTGGEGAGGISLLLVERDRPSFARTPLKKMGWWCSDTATLHFDDVRVPADNLIGRENEGFRPLMANFNRERLGLAGLAIGFAKRCLQDTVTYARERIVFGRPLTTRQVVRHKIVEMARRIRASEAFAESLAWRLMQGEEPVADICLLKNQATLTLEYCAREAVQTFGGAGFMRPSAVERIYREVRVYAIGGGAEEIMRELAARQMGLGG
ncbi:MAG: acyl-CoA dehydrogenase [Alphaproteobacteria bacterium]|nr:MAG: acyl-CoA dehydrogenase [Alphaproteobacteria bacterium]